MFEAVRKNKRISQIILGIIIIPFAFFGMDAYFSDAPGGGEVAKVGGSKISMVEFDQALREQEERMRAAMGERFDRAIVGTEMFRRSVLDNLINQRVLLMHAQETRMAVTPQQLQAVIGSNPAFLEDGQFSTTRYQALLRAQGMSPVMFEARMAQDLRLQQVMGAISDSEFVSKATAKRLLTAQMESREVSESVFSASAFAAEAKLEEGAAQRFYDQNPAQFEHPPRVRVEYVVLDGASLGDQVTVDDAQIEQFYQGNQARFGRPEARRARHILFTVDAGAAEDVVAKAREKADETLATLRAQPERFEELARTESQDPGSASAGGDLGFFGRDEMVEAFSDAAFALPEGQISDVVRSEFGFHIIQVTGIQPAEVKPLAEVRGEIVEELRRQEVGRKLAMAAEQFANTVYEQPDSLAPAAESLGLNVQTSDWVNRDAGGIGPYRSEKLIEALFAEDSLSSRHNVEAVEVSRGVYVSARVIEYEQAQRQPFDDVREGIEQQLLAQASARLAREKGEALLADLQAGREASVEWKNERRFTRQTAGLPPAALEAVFTAPSATLPTYVGAALPGGEYAVYRLQAVERPAPAEDDASVIEAQSQYASLLSESDFAAYLGALKERYKVEVRAAALRNTNQDQ